MQETDEKKVSGVYLIDNEGELMCQSIHRSWLNSVDATETTFRKKEYSGILDNSFLEKYNGCFENIDKEADIYVVETPIAALRLKELKEKNPESEIIYLATSWKLYGLQPYNLDKENVHNNLRAINETITSYLTRRSVRKYCDRIITISPLYKRKLKDIFPKKEIEIVKPISKNKVNANLDLGSHNAMFVGENRDHKGVDLLVEAWSEVIEKIPDAKLFLVGQGHENHNQQGVETLGYVDELEDAYKNKSLYIHPARVDGYAASVIEAMRAGVPTIVTNQTGAKSEVSKISEELIVPPEPEDLAQNIINYFKKPKEEKHGLSQKFQQETEELTYEKSENQFKEAVLK